MDPTSGRHRRSFDTDVTRHSTVDFQGRQGMCCVAPAPSLQPSGQDSKYFSRLLSYWMSRGMSRVFWCCDSNIVRVCGAASVWLPQQQFGQNCRKSVWCVQTAAAYAYDNGLRCLMDRPDTTFATNKRSLLQVLVDPTADSVAAGHICINCLM